MSFCSLPLYPKPGTKQKGSDPLNRCLRRAVQQPIGVGGGMPLVPHVGEFLLEDAGLSGFPPPGWARTLALGKEVN